MIDLVITGTGRCGTTWMSEWLTGAGYPCTHEQAFSYRGWTPAPGSRADASWLAVPYLGLFGGRIIHLVRNPLAYVRSAVGTGLFGTFRRRTYKPWRIFIAQHHGYTDDPPIQQAMRFWVDWNRRIEEHTNERYQIEAMPDYRLTASLEINPDAPIPPPTVNQHQRMELDRLPRDGCFDELAELASRYGYDASTF